MVLTKRILKNLIQYYIIIYICLFPFGQLLKADFMVFGNQFSINLADMLVLFSIPAILITFKKRPAVSKYISDFLLVSGFSLVLSLKIIDTGELVRGIFYFVRLVSFSAFFIFVWNSVREGIISRKVLLGSLIIISIFTAVYGWIQYIWIPNLVDLKYLNWDDHLFRMAGTFLDPAYTSLIIAFGGILTFTGYLKDRKKIYLTAFIFLTVSLLFTYARASYIAFMIGIIAVLFKYKNDLSKVLILCLFLFTATYLILPRNKSEGTVLTRIVSIDAKIANYRETLEIIKEYPVFGVGFNNLCFARIEKFGGNTASHACSGADSSLLFVLATTGIIGLLVFINMSVRFLISGNRGYYHTEVLACCLVLFVHSFFVQSALYTFVMGYMGILFALSLKD